jgi:hypothetical protein
LDSGTVRWCSHPGRQSPKPFIVYLTSGTVKWCSRPGWQSPKPLLIWTQEQLGGAVALSGTVRAAAK